VSLPALVFLLILTLFAALWEYLLWWALRHGNRAVLLHSSGLVVLLFAIPLSIALYNLLVKPFLHVTWPWTWVSNGLAWLFFMVCVGPLLWVGFGLLWDGPRQRITSQPDINRKWMLITPAIGCLLGFLGGFNWLGLGSLLHPLVGLGSVHIGLGTFSPDEFQWGFFIGTSYVIAAIFGPRLEWWVRTFSERRWFLIGTTLLLLGIMLVAVLLWS
jgi:hypothetical protein